MGDAAEKRSVDTGRMSISALTERVLRVGKSDTAFNESALRLV